MQTALLKEYVSKAKDLELSCYEQKLLCDNLEQKLSHINYQRKNKENEKKEFKKFGWIDYIAGAIGWGICVVPPLIGISGLVAVALYIIAGICDIMHFSIPFIDRIIYIYIITNPGIGAVKLLLNCIIIGAGGGFLLLFLCGIISGSKKNVKKENQKIEENNTNVQKELIAYESKSQIISNNLACARRSYQTTLKTKEDFYSLNIIYPKYRDLVSVGMFDEYLQSGRCYTLTIDLTPIEFQILYILASHPGQAYSKERLYELIWKEPYFGNENVLNTHINRLRLKLKSNAEDSTAYVKTLWGIRSTYF